MGKIRGTHSSPGIYTKITDVEYTTRHAGITTLGLVGETLKGPAFEPIDIESWPQFVTYFGGKSAEKFKDSQYPKYELPYIAESYLKASDQLKVCRVLGLSGYNAGPAWLITAKGENKEYVIAVIRARAQYKKYGKTANCVSTYDEIVYSCDKIELKPYKDINLSFGCTGSTPELDQGDFSVDVLNHGRFTIVATKDGKPVGTYPVSFNSGAKDFIYNVIGTDAQKGNAAIFVEELYDVMLDELIEKGKVNEINSAVTLIKSIKYDPVTNPVADFVSIPEDNLEKKNLGITFVYAADQLPKDIESGAVTYHVAEGSGYTSHDMEEGHVYIVKSYYEKNEKKYGYFEVLEAGSAVTLDVDIVSEKTEDTYAVVKVLSYDEFVYFDKESEKVSFFATNMNDYREQYRYASTPWVVSELKGSADGYEVKKLFRFHTITDGNYANTEVKISIANIRPDEGTFDVYIRDFYDSDANPTIYESYKGVNLVPGTSKYLGLKIGTLDGAYETVSKFVLVEIADNEAVEYCVPAGFLGYPVRDYGENIEAPYFTYNREVLDDIREKKQYFGLSDITGIDVDMLSYKGRYAYTENYDRGYTHAFHLDSRLDESILEGITGLSAITVYLDGEELKDVIWDTVYPSNITNEGKQPIIAGEAEMEGTIYEDIKLRKFTLCPCGGFDGWDIYRSSRTNTDEYKANKYKGTIKNGEGAAFSTITDGTGLALTGNCITSDYYAYLAGINQFENPERYEINLFATPGIDYVNNELLVNDAIDMVENRLDTFYVITTPDKPWGASDAIDEMYSSQDAADNLDDSSIDTYYGSSYYPWVKFFDESNNIYINLPATKDAVRVMANTDNKRYPWIAPAGVERGVVECKKMHFYAKLEDRDNVYDSRLNPLMTFKEGVRIWGNKTLYVCEETNPMNRINSVRLMLYMRKLIIAASIGLIFEPEDETLQEEFEGNLKPILAQIKADRGITDWDLKTSQTEEQMDLHELSGTVWVKPTPALEAIEINFVVTPQGVKFTDVA